MPETTIPEDISDAWEQLQGGWPVDFTSFEAAKSMARYIGHFYHPSTPGFALDIRGSNGIYSLRYKGADDEGKKK